jgi:predicted HAD superfamily Cof-like phosphohydrolase
MTERARCLSEIPSRIRAMNKMYELPVQEVPSLNTYSAKRLDAFLDIIVEELKEGDAIHESMTLGIEDEVTQLTDLADWFADMIVYIYSEATRCGIPLAEVLQIVMDSNESKLDEDGKPIKDGRDKFLKGPNYWKPEPKIKELLLKKLGVDREGKDQDLPLGS